MLRAVCATSVSWTWCDKLFEVSRLLPFSVIRYLPSDSVICWPVVALLQDHHCLFLGKCIGRRNHRHFLLAMFWAILGCLYAAVCCACLLARRRHQVQLQSPVYSFGRQRHTTNRDATSPFAPAVRTACWLWCAEQSCP